LALRKEYLKAGFDNGNDEEVLTSLCLCHATFCCCYRFSFSLCVSVFKSYSFRKVHRCPKTYMPRFIVRIIEIGMFLLSQRAYWWNCHNTIVIIVVLCYSLCLLPSLTGVSRTFLFKPFLTCYPKLHLNVGVITPIQSHMNNNFSLKWTFISVAHPVKREHMTNYNH